MNKAALVTGSVSGIGKAIARELAIRGYNLFLVDIQDEALKQQQEEWEKEYKIQVRTFSIDLSKDTAAEEVYQYALDQHVEVEILVNNAGIFFFSEVAETEPEKASRLVHLHIHTFSMLCVYFSKSMKERRSGHILNVSSISAYKDFPGIAFYASSKRYIKSFSRSMRTELKYHGVNVTALCPGATATELYDPNVIDVKKGMRYGIMMTAEKVARIGVKGMFRKKAVIIPGALTKIMTFFSILTPQWMIYLIRKRWRRLFEA